MKKNNFGFSIVIALWLVVLISLLAVGILEFIIPFSRNNKWVENSSASYYQANSWRENALYAVWTWVLWDEPSDNLWLGSVDYSFNVEAMWKNLPPDWEWNSEFDQNWDIISPWKPIQMEVWNNSIDLDDLNIAFRVPNFAWTLKTLSWTSLPIINWQLSADNNTLNAFSWNYIKANDICDSEGDFDDRDFYLNHPDFRQWIDLNDKTWTWQEIKNFYDDNCQLVWSSCILKLSIINDLQTNDLEYIPYLEWRMQYSWFSDIPLRYTIINSEWKSYWFKKSLQIKVPQKTVSEAFDFTVFQ